VVVVVVDEVVNNTAARPAWAGAENKRAGIGRGDMDPKIVAATSQRQLFANET
jgi:hypothetical protein